MTTVLLLGLLLQLLHFRLQLLDVIVKAGEFFLEDELALFVLRLLGGGAEQVGAGRP